LGQRTVQGSNNADLHHVYATLFERIARNEYEGATWLREEALAQEFGLSRSPIRKVLRQLQQDKLVELVPNRGARVLSFTADDIEEIYEIRKALEPTALRLGSQRLSLEQLFSFNRQIQDLELTADPADHARVDGLFHQYLLECSNSPRVIDIVNDLYRLLQRFRELAFQDEEVRSMAIQEHSQIIYALVIRDISKASEALVRHIDNSKIRILTRVFRQGQEEPESSDEGKVDSTHK